MTEETPAKKILNQLENMEQTILEVGSSLLKSLEKKLSGVEHYHPNDKEKIDKAKTDFIRGYLLLSALKQIGNIPTDVELALVPVDYVKDLPQGILTKIHIQTPDIKQLIASIKDDTLFQVPKPVRSFQYGSSYYADAHKYNQ